MNILKFSWEPPRGSDFLVMAFEGWNDAGEAATTAVETLVEQLDAKSFASLDPSQLYDFQQVRPQIKVVGGEVQEVRWPSNEFFFSSTSDRNIALGRGTEPNNLWPTYVNSICDVAEIIAPERVIILGALLADIPHTHPFTITGTSSDPEILAELNVTPADYEGPTGVVGVLLDALSKRDIPTTSLWVSVPHYISASPNPKASLALLNRLSGLMRLDLDLDDLRASSEEFVRNINSAVSNSPEIQAYVKLLEQRSETEQETPLITGRIPSGDELAAELQNFLRSHHEDDS